MDVSVEPRAPIKPILAAVMGVQGMVQRGQEDDDTRKKMPLWHWVVGDEARWGDGHGVVVREFVHQSRKQNSHGWLVAALVDVVQHFGAG